MEEDHSEDDVLNMEDIELDGLCTEAALDLDIDRACLKVDWIRSSTSIPSHIYISGLAHIGDFVQRMRRFNAQGYSFDYADIMCRIFRKDILISCRDCVEDAVFIQSTLGIDIYMDGEALHIIASNGHLNMLKHFIKLYGNLYDKRKCFDTVLFAKAAGSGNLDVVKYLVCEQKCPYNTHAAIEAARNGHRHILQYLIQDLHIVLNTDVFQAAVICGCVDLLKLLCWHGCPIPDDGASYHTALELGDFKVFDYLRFIEAPCPPKSEKM